MTPQPAPTLAAVAASLDFVTKQLQACLNALDEPPLRSEQYPLFYAVYVAQERIDTALEILQELGFPPVRRCAARGGATRSKYTRTNQDCKSQ